ncbi:hypothetical protein NDU88_002020 [Pleurodeles waltl]|uniref:Uncharacterized protein n=1 Tax=Pleurodeles waltl TaxID=8319 RepID=A0AAV7UXQ9_PLEWA|nr:hypothetical protein NDU88_002020 [Pleurodeles waltl]
MTHSVRVVLGSPPQSSVQAHLRACVPECLRPSLEPLQPQRVSVLLLLDPWWTGGGYTVVRPAGPWHPASPPRPLRSKRFVVCCTSARSTAEIGISLFHLAIRLHSALLCCGPAQKHCGPADLTAVYLPPVRRGSRRVIPAPQLNRPNRPDCRALS